MFNWFGLSSNSAMLVNYRYFTVLTERILCEMYSCEATWH